MDINSIVSDYLSKNSDVKLDRISEAIENLTPDGDIVFENYDDTSIFTSSGLSKEEFLDFCSNATGKDADEIAEDVDILFSIIDRNNENGGEGTLTSDELDFLEISGENKMNSFTLWDRMSSFEAGAVEQRIKDKKAEEEKTEETTGTDDTTGTGDTTGVGNTTGTTNDDADEDADANADADADADTSVDAEDVPTVSQGKSNVDFDNPTSVKKFINSFIDDSMTTPSAVVDWMLAEGIITDDQAALVEKAYMNYTEAEQTQIDNLMSLGYTYEEAIDKLGDKLANADSDFDKKPEAEPEPVKVIDDDTAKLYAAQLHDAVDGLGTDDEQFASIMNNKDLSSADLVKIIDIYNDKYGSFVKAIEGDFSGDTQKKYQQKVADALLERLEADPNDKTALELLCKEFYNGTKGMTGTADDFIARIMEKASDKTLASLYKNFSTYNNGADLIKVIKKDFSGKTEDKYIKQFNEALSAD